MTNLDSLFVLSWSHSQKVFHIECIKDMLEANLNAFKNKYPVDFIPIALTTSVEDAYKIQKELETK